MLSRGAIATKSGWYRQLFSRGRDGIEVSDKESQCRMTTAMTKKNIYAEDRELKYLDSEQRRRNA